MLTRPRQVFAILLGPVLLLLFFIATVPSDAQSSIAYVLFAYALAHICFWPPVLAAKYVGRRLQFNSALSLASLVGGFSLIMALAFATPFVFVHMDVNYGWQAVIRDALSDAGATVGSYIFYRAVLGIEPRNELGGA
jgi:hypothetical protein